MKTIATKVNNEVYNKLVNECDNKGITVSEKLRDLIKNEGNLSDSIDYQDAFEHMKECENCNKAMINKGYILVSLDELKKYHLVPAKNQVRGN